MYENVLPADELHLVFWKWPTRSKPSNHTNMVVGVLVEVLRSKILIRVCSWHPFKEDMICLDMNMDTNMKHMNGLLYECPQV